MFVYTHTNMYFGSAGKVYFILYLIIKGLKVIYLKKYFSHVLLGDD